MADKTNSDVPTLTFEKAIEELESIVKRLEEGKVPLEELVAIYERGEALKRRCEELLRQAEARVEKITLDAAGKPTGTGPLDVKLTQPAQRSQLGAKPSPRRYLVLRNTSSVLNSPTRFTGARFSHFCTIGSALFQAIEPM